MGALILRFWPQIVMGALAVAAALFFGLWQSAREEVGVQKEAKRQAEAQTATYATQLKAANDKIRATAAQGAQSYAACQEIARLGSIKDFDKGVIFGRSTCAASRSPPASASQPAPRPSPR